MYYIIWHNKKISNKYDIIKCKLKDNSMSYEKNSGQYFFKNSHFYNVYYLSSKKCPKNI
jgi:hypothetical protein